MCYQNGKKILPPPLLSAIQEYIDGEYIYIPLVKPITNAPGDRPKVQNNKLLNVIRKYSAVI